MKVTNLTRDRSRMMFFWNEFFLIVLNLLIHEIQIRVYFTHVMNQKFMFVKALNHYLVIKLDD